jgi:hypothetical protein
MSSGSTNAGGLGSANKSESDKAKEVVSALSKMASSGSDGIRAAFSEVKADGDKVIVNPPGMASKEIPNKSTNSILSEGVKLMDIFKVAAGIALSILTGNPIPLMLAKRHSNNIAERIKAKKREIDNKIKLEKKAIKLANTSIRKSLVKSKLNKDEADYRQLRALEGRIAVKQKQADVDIKMAGKQAVRDLKDIDRDIRNRVSKSFVRMGFKSSDAKAAADLALTKTIDRSINAVLKIALSEIVALQKSK